MKTKKLMTAIGLLGLLSMNLATASSGNGNGGVSVVCRDSNNKITSAELLDIYEGQVRYEKVYNNDFDLDEHLAVLESKLQKRGTFSLYFFEELQKARGAVRYIPNGNGLSSTDDAFPTVFKEGCGFEQLANYTDEGQLLISEEIFNELSKLDRSALFVHEAIYALFREAGATDSRESRRLTAELLAENTDESVVDQIISNNAGRLGFSCGLKGSIEERIKNCHVKREMQGPFNLVSRTKEGFEVYKDLSTGLLWGNVLQNKVDYRRAKAACHSNLKEVAGITEVNWRLPTPEDFKEFDSKRDYFKGNLVISSQHWLWSSSGFKFLGTYAFLYNQLFGYNGPLMYYSVKKDFKASVICVGEEK